MEPIEVRVERSLKRCGFPEIRVIDLGNGHIKLTGNVPSKDDRGAVLSMALTVPGVSQVSYELD